VYIIGIFCDSLIGSAELAGPVGCNDLAAKIEQRPVDVLGSSNALRVKQQHPI
jgi:hypothetical protein